MRLKWFLCSDEVLLRVQCSYIHIDVCSMHRLQTWNNLLLLVFSSSLYYQIFVQMLLSSPTTTTTTICDIREKTFRACSYHLHSTHPLHFDAKIEMTYFIYNWNFQRCVYAYMNESVDDDDDDDYDYDCWLWPVRVFGRLHVLVSGMSGRSFISYQSILLLPFV